MTGDFSPPKDLSGIRAFLAANAHADPTINRLYGTPDLIPGHQQYHEEPLIATGNHVDQEA